MLFITVTCDTYLPIDPCLSDKITYCNTCIDSYFELIKRLRRERYKWEMGVTVCNREFHWSIYRCIQMIAKIMLMQTTNPTLLSLQFVPHLCTRRCGKNVHVDVCIHMHARSNTNISCFCTNIHSCDNGHIGWASNNRGLCPVVGTSPGLAIYCEGQVKIN